MKEPAWTKYVKWPPCDDCKASGVRVCKRTQWPEECLRCKPAREAAVKRAEADVRALRKQGLEA